MADKNRPKAVESEREIGNSGVARSRNSTHTSNFENSMRIFQMVVFREKFLELNTT